MLTRIIITFLLSIVFQSCCIKLDLEEADLEWLNPYEVDQVKVFKSNQNHLDSIRIVNKEIIKPSGDCNWFEIGPYSPAQAIIDYKYFHNGKWSEVKNLFYLEKRPRGEKTTPLFRVLNLEAYRDLKEENLSSSLGKKSYNDSYVFSGNDVQVLYPDEGIRKFY